LSDSLLKQPHNFPEKAANLFWYKIWSSRHLILVVKVTSFIIGFALLNLPLLSSAPLSERVRERERGAEREIENKWGIISSFAF
jgi:hypothetical protein